MLNIHELRDINGRFISTRVYLLKMLFWFVMLSAGTFAVTSLLVTFNDWSARHVVQFPVVVTTRPIIIEREPQKILTPLAQEILSSTEPASTLTVGEQAIMDTFGKDEYRVAHAVAKCESGLRADAVNWETHDVGLMQINMPIWEKPIKEKFGYTLKDLFDPKKNAEVAHWIWDRGDGIEGNGKGNYTAWVATTSNCFVKEL